MSYFCAYPSLFCLTLSPTFRISYYDPIHNSSNSSLHAGSWLACTLTPTMWPERQSRSPEGPRHRSSRPSHSQASQPSRKARAGSHTHGLLALNVERQAEVGHEVRPADGKARTRHACAVPVASHYRNTPHRVRQRTGDIGAGTPTGHLHRLPLSLRRRRGVEQLTENVKMGRKDRFKYADARTRTHSVTLFLSCGYSPTHTRTPIKIIL